MSEDGVTTIYPLCNRESPVAVMLQTPTIAIVSQIESEKIYSFDFNNVKQALSISL